MAAGSDRFVSLRGGCTIPVEPLIVIFDLQERGFTLTPEGHALVVQPHQRLTPEDCRRITQWKQHILSLLTYEPPEVG